MRLDRIIPMAVLGGVALYAAARALDTEAGTLDPPTKFEPDDIEGEWHIVAHIPYLLEKNRVAPTISFTRRTDGKLDEVFTAQKGGFDAPRESVEQLTWAPEPAQPWKLKTLLFGFLPVRYQVLLVDTKAGVALVGTTDRDKAWIFKRTSQLSEAAYQRAVATFKAQGFDTTRILRIPQRPADLGKPGYAPIED
jgi:apolipoprotein D and lipocalin family protein